MAIVSSGLGFFAAALPLAAAGNAVNARTQHPITNTLIMRFMKTSFYELC
jgi:hypothetical protein